MHVLRSQNDHGKKGCYLYVVIATPSFTKHSLTESFRILPISNISLLKLIFAHGTKMCGWVNVRSFLCEGNWAALGSWTYISLRMAIGHWPGRAYKFGKRWKRMRSWCVDAVIFRFATCVKCIVLSFEICGFYSCGRRPLATDDIYLFYLYKISAPIPASILMCLDRLSYFRHSGFWLLVLITP